MRKNILSLGIITILSTVTLISSSFFTPANAASSIEIPQQKWAFDGIPASWDKLVWDKASFKRGYQVATESCMACHSLKYISHRDMMAVGFSEAEVKAMAENLEMNINDKMLSELTAEDGKEAYGNPLPDLSLMVRARADGANYLYALLTGYEDETPEGFAEISDDLYFNRYFPGHAIAMPPPLEEDYIEYEDGTAATVEQMAKDVTYFLAWAAEPELLERKQWGFNILIYLFIFLILSYLLKCAVWRDIKSSK